MPGEAARVSKTNGWIQGSARKDSHVLAEIVQSSGLRRGRFPGRAPVAGVTGQSHSSQRQHKHGELLPGAGWVGTVGWRKTQLWACRADL